jgi:hypothetical protein
MKLNALAVAFALALAGCSDNELDREVTVDVSGSWGGTVRNESNSCPGQFNVGDTTTIQVTITQDNSKVNLKVEGGVGFLVQLALGSNEFQGTQTGDKIDVSLLGSRQQTEGTCTYTYTANLVGRVQGQQMTGTVTYKPNPRTGDCSAIASCSRVQSFDVDKGKLLTDAGVLDTAVSGG